MTRQPDGRPHSDQHLWPTRPVCQQSWYRATVMQNSPFLPQRWRRPPPVLIVPTHGGMARLSRPGWLWLNTKMVYPWTVTHPSTNRARHRATTLIKTNALPLSQAAKEEYSWAASSIRVCSQYFCEYQLKTIFVTTVCRQWRITRTKENSHTCSLLPYGSSAVFNHLQNLLNLWLDWYTRERSPIPVLTGPGVEQLHWSRPTRYH